jgi:DNA-binding beta-propeller fold protein YncE
MNRYAIAFVLGAAAACMAQVKEGPALPHKVVKDWAKLPDGWNFGETSGVAVDKDDNVWVFNRGNHPVLQFDSNGKMLRSWPEVPIKSSHGIRVDEEGNVWTVDVKGHQLFKWTPTGRLLMVLGRGPGKDDSKDAFNEPTGIAFAKNGDLYISDGYVNSRVVRYGKDGVYQSHWGRKGTGDGEFQLVHDVAVDTRGRVYVADRTNERIQIFDENGKFLTKWTGLGAPWGLAYAAKENAIYMCDGVNNRVVRLNMEGQVTGVLSSFGKTPGKLDYAHNIAVDSVGNIYVAEIKNWRVQKFAK